MKRPKHEVHASSGLKATSSEKDVAFKDISSCHTALAKRRLRVIKLTVRWVAVKPRCNPVNGYDLQDKDK